MAHRNKLAKSKNARKLGIRHAQVSSSDKLTRVTDEDVDRLVTDQRYMFGQVLILSDTRGSWVAMRISALDRIQAKPYICARYGSFQSANDVQSCG